MFRKVVAASFVAIWLLLLGIEFSEEIGLFEYSEPEVEKSVEAMLFSLEEAIKVSDVTHVGTLRPLAGQPDILYPSVFQAVLFKRVSKETKFVKEGIPIYKLNRVFLI